MLCLDFRYCKTSGYVVPSPGCCRREAPLPAQAWFCSQQWWRLVLCCSVKADPHVKCGSLPRNAFLNKSNVKLCFTPLSFSHLSNWWRKWVLVNINNQLGSAAQFTIPDLNLCGYTQATSQHQAMPLHSGKVWGQTRLLYIGPVDSTFVMVVSTIMI